MHLLVGEVVLELDFASVVVAHTYTSVMSTPKNTGVCLYRMLQRLRRAQLHCTHKTKAVSPLTTCLSQAFRRDVEPPPLSPHPNPSPAALHATDTSDKWDLRLPDRSLSSPHCTKRPRTVRCESSRGHGKSNCAALCSACVFALTLLGELLTHVRNDPAVTYPSRSIDIHKDMAKRRITAVRVVHAQRMFGCNRDC